MLTWYSIGAGRDRGPRLVTVSETVSRPEPVRVVIRRAHRRCTQCITLLDDPRDDELELLPGDGDPVGVHVAGRSGGECAVLPVALGGDADILQAAGRQQAPTELANPRTCAGRGGPDLTDTREPTERYALEPGGTDVQTPVRQQPGRDAAGDLEIEGALRLSRVQTAHRLAGTGELIGVSDETRGEHRCRPWKTAVAQRGPPRRSRAGSSTVKSMDRA